MLRMEEKYPLHNNDNSLIRKGLILYSPEKSKFLK